VVIACKTDQKPVDTDITEKPAISFSSVMIDHHNLPIATMGDIENYLR
jgi:hypothetical protein